MNLKKINVQQTIDKAKALIAEEKNLSIAFKAIFETLLLIITLFCNKLGFNSENSSKSPATDPNRKRGTKNKKNNGKKPGGQNGHIGNRLNKIDNPDKIEILSIDKRTLPSGNYQEVGYESRQVFNIEISRIVTEYRAQVLEDEFGNRYVAEFPEYVTKDVQYGQNVKAHSVYMSQFQLLPYNRIQDYFTEQMNLPISSGSIYNFNAEAYNLLEIFDNIAKNKLISAPLIHVDETSAHVDKSTIWLHNASNDLWTYIYPHKKRGTEAMEEIGILPKFQGILCHDHWKPYYTYDCTHSLCNAHHLRELEWSYKEDKQLWAKEIQDLLIEIKNAVEDSGINKLTNALSLTYRNKYKRIIAKGKLECSRTTDIIVSAKNRIKKSKSRNLLERLASFEDDTLRFMEEKIVPFTNNQSENDIRMTKVQQKISGCFRSMEGAKFFCRIRSYLSTCRKNGFSITNALMLLFKGKMPDFICNSV
jgi:transposase